MIPVENSVLVKKMEEEKEIKRAISSMIKLPSFDRLCEPNFEWPSSNEILAMPKDRSYKLKSISF